MALQPIDPTTGERLIPRKRRKRPNPRPRKVRGNSHYTVTNRLRRAARLRGLKRFFKGKRFSNLVKAGGAGRPRKGYIDAQGRECSRCGWYKHYVDRGGKRNFRLNSQRGTRGYRSKCVDCESRDERKRRARERKEQAQ